MGWFWSKKKPARIEPMLAPPELPSVEFFSWGKYGRPAWVDEPRAAEWALWPSGKPLPEEYRCPEPQARFQSNDGVWWVVEEILQHRRQVQEANDSAPLLTWRASTPTREWLGVGQHRLCWDKERHFLMVHRFCAGKGWSSVASLPKELDFSVLLGYANSPNKDNFYRGLSSSVTCIGLDTREAPWGQSGDLCMLSQWSTMIYWPANTPMSFDESCRYLAAACQVKYVQKIWYWLRRQLRRWMTRDVWFERLVGSLQQLFSVDEVSRVQVAIHAHRWGDWVQEFKQDPGVLPWLSQERISAWSSWQRRSAGEPGGARDYIKQTQGYPCWSLVADPYDDGGETFWFRQDMPQWLNQVRPKLYRELWRSYHQSQGKHARHRLTAIFVAELWASAGITHLPNWAAREALRWPLPELFKVWGVANPKPYGLFHPDLLTDDRLGHSALSNLAQSDLSADEAHVVHHLLMLYWREMSNPKSYWHMRPNGFDVEVFKSKYWREHAERGDHWWSQFRANLPATWGEWQQQSLEWLTQWRERPKPVVVQEPAPTVVLSSPQFVAQRMLNENRWSSILGPMVREGVTIIPVCRKERVLREGARFYNCLHTHSNYWTNCARGFGRLFRLEYRGQEAMLYLEHQGDHCWVKNQCWGPFNKPCSDLLQRVADWVVNQYNLLDEKPTEDPQVSFAGCAGVAPPRRLEAPRETSPTIFASDGDQGDLVDMFDDVYNDLLDDDP